MNEYRSPIQKRRTIPDGCRSPTDAFICTVVAPTYEGGVTKALDPPTSEPLAYRNKRAPNLVSGSDNRSRPSYIGDPSYKAPSNIGATAVTDRASAV